MIEKKGIREALAVVGLLSNQLISLSAKIDVHVPATNRKEEMENDVAECFRLLGEVKGSLEKVLFFINLLGRIAANENRENCEDSERVL